MGLVLRGVRFLGLQFCDLRRPHKPNPKTEPLKQTLGFFVVVVGQLHEDAPIDPGTFNDVS